MSATVNVNNLTVVHKDSSGIVSGFPDVCKTPSPAGPVPIPYPNLAKSQDTTQGSQTVTMEGIAIHRFENGKMVEHWGNEDDLGLMQQLGVILGDHVQVVFGNIV